MDKVKETKNSKPGRVAKDVKNEELAAALEILRTKDQYVLRKCDPPLFSEELLSDRYRHLICESSLENYYPIDELISASSHDGRVCVSKKLSSNGDQSSSDHSPDNENVEDVPCIRISNLDKTTTREDLTKLVEPFGKVKNQYLTEHYRSHLCKGIAFVTYEDRADADRAFHGLDGFKFKDAELQTEWAKPRNRLRRRSRISIFIENLSSSTTTQDVKQLVQPFQATKQILKTDKRKKAIVYFKDKSEAEEAIKKLNGHVVNDLSLNVDWSTSKPKNHISIRIDNLDESTTRKDFGELVKPLGKIKKKYLSEDRKTRLCKGFAYVHFKKVSDAEKAIEVLNNTTFKDATLKADWAPGSQNSQSQVVSES